MQHPDNDAPDVLPPPVNRILALLWILLLGGRWIVGTWLLAAGVLKEEQLAVWDVALLRLYLVLLVVTLVVVALRIVRASHPAVPAAQSPQSGPSNSPSRNGATTVGEADSRRSAKSGAARRRVQRP